MISREDAKKMHLWKYALAALGMAYIVGTAVWLVYTAMRTDGAPTGPTELALNPERQDEILAQRRADGLREKLGLSNDQAAQVAAIMQEFQGRRKEMLQGGTDTGPFQRFQAAMQMRNDLRGRLETVLTQEQLTKFEETVQQRFNGAVGALRQTGVNPMAGGPPPSSEERRDRVMQMLQPAAPATEVPAQ